MKARVLVCLVVVVCAHAFGQTPASTGTTTKDVPFVQQLRKTVTFIQMLCLNSSGTETDDVRGTAFFLTMPDERLGKDQGFFYLVTNRHVAECWDEARHPRTVRAVLLRFNLIDGSSSNVPVSRNGNAHWIFPTDDSVDLGILPLKPDETKVDYKAIPISAFATDDVIASRGVEEGTKIMFAGFFYQFAGQKKMLPIVREGIIAMMPDEKLENTTGRLGNAYLGDVHIFGGNSGSPVFVDVGGVHGNRLSGDEYHFLGVISGLFYEDAEFNLTVATTLTGVTHANSGIALIVPANDLKTLLDGREAQASRDATVIKLKEGK